METLTLGGKQYVKATKAARDLGYATDYVGQLCRTGKVDAHLVGRTWYVNVDMLGAHRVEKKRNARLKAREYAQKSIAEARNLNVAQSAKGYRNIEIRYQPDTRPVLPDTKKLHIATEKFVEPVSKGIDETRTDDYEVLNKDKKIIMSGSVPVYDAEEETVLTDTVILSPRIVHPKKEKEPSSAPHQKQVAITSFDEKLASIEEVGKAVETPTTELPVEVDADTAQGKRSDIFQKILKIILFLTASVSVLGLFIEIESVYSSGSMTSSATITTSLMSDFILKYIGISS
jgi:hypothetical protein